MLLVLFSLNLCVVIQIALFLRIFALYFFTELVGDEKGVDVGDRVSVILTFLS